MSQYLRYTKAPTSNILSSWLNDGYIFTKEEAMNTSIIFCGGRTIPLIDEFKQVIQKRIYY